MKILINHRHLIKSAACAFFALLIAIIPLSALYPAAFDPTIESLEIEDDMTSISPDASSETDPVDDPFTDGTGSTGTTGVGGTTAVGTTNAGTNAVDDSDGNGIASLIIGIIIIAVIVIVIIGVVSAKMK